MKKYEGCPKEYKILEENHLFIKLFRFIGTQNPIGGGLSLILPAQFWPRFVIDEDWRASLFARYGKRVFTEDYPKKDLIVNGRNWSGGPQEGEDCSGIVPEDLPYAFTKFPNCPQGYSKHNENDQEIKLGFYYIDGSDGGNLIVPAILWDRFVTDKKWRSKMIINYARLNELDYKSPEEIIQRFGEKELNKTGIIPESEYSN